MAKKRKRKSKARTVQKKRTDLDKLKEQQSILYTRVNDSLQIIKNQTKMSDEVLASFIEINGYEGLIKLPNLDIAEPIFNNMVKSFHLYDKISSLIARLERAERKVLIHDIEQKTIEMETKLAEIEKEDSFYTQLPDKEGMTKMKEKYHAEKQYWEEKKYEAEVILGEKPDDKQAKAQYERCKEELVKLRKTRNYARLKNIQPTITKWTQKISRGINETTQGIADIGNQFGELGKVGSEGGSSSNNYGFSPDQIFGKAQPKQTKTKKQKSESQQEQKDYDFFGGF